MRGTIDTGCSSLVVGEITLSKIAVALSRLYGLRIPLTPYNKKFRFANGSTTVSLLRANTPIGLEKRHGILKVAVVPGNTPLLISEGVLEDLGAIIDTAKGILKIQQLGLRI